MKKRVISFCTAAVLALSSAAASAESIKDVIYQNATGAGQWTDPGSGQQFFYGGNYAFRFKNHGVYAPWFNVGSPEVAVGCNGLSISGGFLSLLGLDDIENQLKDAGAEFAWGVVMTIKSSLPVVAEVFEAIQAWARTIQNLLQNACQMGQQAGKAMGMDKMFTSVFDDETEGGSNGDSAIGLLKSESEKLTKSAEKVDEWVNDPAKKFKLTDTVSKDVDHVRNAGGGVSFFSYIFGRFFRDDPSKPLNISSTGEVLSGNAPFLQNASGEQWDQAVLRYKIARLLFGELAVKGQSLAALTKVFDGSGQFDAEALKAQIKAGYYNAGTPAEWSGPVLLAPKMDAKTAALAMMKGFSALDGSVDGCSGDTCRIDSNRVIYLSLKTKSTSGSQSTHLKVVALVSDQTGTPSSLTWRGFYLESLEAINYLVKQKVMKVKPSYVFYEGNTQTSTMAPGSVSAPLMMPSIHKYIGIIAKLEMRFGQETATTMNLKRMLAKMNAYLSARQLAGAFEGLLQEVMTDPKTSGGKEEAQNLKLLMDRTHEISSAIVLELDEQAKNDDKIKAFVDTFRQIELDMKKERAEGGL